MDSKLPAYRRSWTVRRDHRGERIARTLKADPVIGDAPGWALRSLADLIALGIEVKAKLSERGVVKPDGSFDEGVDMLRRLKDSEARYAATIVQLTRGHNGRQTLDLDAMRLAADAGDAQQLAGNATQSHANAKDD